MLQQLTQFQWFKILYFSYSVAKILLLERKRVRVVLFATFDGWHWHVNLSKEICRGYLLAIVAVVDAFSLLPFSLFLPYC